MSTNGYRRRKNGMSGVEESTVNERTRDRGAT